MAIGRIRGGPLYASRAPAAVKPFVPADGALPWWSYLLLYGGVAWFAFKFALENAEPLPNPANAAIAPAGLAGLGGSTSVAAPNGLTTRDLTVYRRSLGTPMKIGDSGYTGNQLWTLSQVIDLGKEARLIFSLPTGMKKSVSLNIHRRDGIRVAYLRD